ncbi:MAG: SDR family oxidoreductase [Deltaproteobacteria bacterium]|nr:SDR family oxidoreductase [Deltaproteobacteria bacterium]
MKTMLITGTRKGIGKYLVEYYLDRGYRIFGCSREPVDYDYENYTHFCLDVVDEKKVTAMFAEIGRTHKRLDVLINNAGIASMNHILLTPVSTVHNILNTNVVGTFIFCREAAKLMMKNRCGRIVNFATVATPLKLEGEAIYAASKAAIVNLTEILARELGQLGVTVNAVGPTPVKTDLIRSVPQEKIDSLLRRQAINRFGEFQDISNVIDFFIAPESDFVTGQVVYLGGVC